MVRTSKRLLYISLIAMLYLACSQLFGKEKPQMSDRTARFAGKWGVFFHFLGNKAGQRDGSKSSEAWNKQVDAFDVKGLAAQLKRVGASYFVITIGQGSGHYCAPNAVYDETARVSPSKCSRRDLVADLYEELNPLGIRLLVYTAAEMSWADEKARVGLGLKHHHNDPGSGGTKIWRKHRQVEFMRNIEKILRAWSLQWGRKVDGWWVDGCYVSDVRFPENDPPNFATLSTALRAGNPDAIVAFNTGVHVPVIVSTKHDDYTAGELSKKFPEKIPGPWLEKDGKKVRYHTLSYLGTTWGQGDKPRFDDAFVVKFTKQVTEKGGFATWDVPPLKNGCIADSFMEQLAAIGEAIK